MKTSIMCLCALTLVTAAALCQDGQRKFYDTKYDDTVDPFIQLEEAKPAAREGKKLLFLDIGGEWCAWCHRLDDFFRENEDISEFLEKHFVPVRINFSLENKNEKFLSAFPTIEGYPHIFVLDENGNLIHSQDTGQLEEGKGYSREKVMKFLSTVVSNAQL